MSLSKRGFTLIELLVVIAIIAVLAAILFPVFAKAREKSRQTGCMNNQKQIATSILMYAQDHDEALPTSASVWTDLGIERGALICPTSGKASGNSYVYNGTYGDWALGEISDPTEAMLTCDGKTGSSGTSTGIANVGAVSGDGIKRHDGRYIMSFADGHVGSDRFIMFSAPKEVQWQSLTGVTATYTEENLGSTLKKTAATSTGYDSGAVGSLKIQSNGYVEFTLNEANQAMVVGLTYDKTGLTGKDATKISYGLRFSEGTAGKLEVFETNVAKVPTETTYNAGQIFRIERKGRDIRYYKDGKVLAKTTITVDTDVTTKLFVDVSIKGGNSSLTNMRVAGAEK